MSATEISMMHVPFLDLKAEYAELASEGIESEILSRLRGTQYIQGAAVESFEKHWAAYCGTNVAVGVDSGTAALELTLRALDIGAGDEVIVPAHTFIATAAAVVLCGATPVFVDAESHYWQMDVDAVKKALTPRTRALIAVHLYGQPVMMDPVVDFCREHGVLLIEDAAQAHGASLHGRRVGSFGMAGCFSFYPAKNLGAFGDAGAVVTNDAALASRIRRLSNHGRITKYEHAEIGQNLRIDEIQGAVLDFKLRHLDGWNQRRRRIAGLYREKLRDLPLAIPEITPGSEPVYHLFPVGTVDRDRLMDHLSTHDIATGVHYPVPLHLQPAFADLAYRRGSMPVAERIGAEELSLPIGPYMTNEQVDYVCEMIHEFYR